MKFVILASLKDEEKKRIQNKKVCDVTEYVMPSDAGIYKGWVGSTEDEYFSVAFVKGVLSVSLEEREMCVGWKIINVGMVEHLHKVISSSKMNMTTISRIVDFYNKNTASKDVKETTFRDIMKVLKWKFKSRKVKVQEHFLNN